MKLWRKKDPTKARAIDARRYDPARARAWRKANPERSKEHHRNHYRKNKAAYIAQNRKRKAICKAQTPPWVDFKEIKDIYKSCPQGFHVDHILPLRGKDICGLNVPWNLQYLSSIDNNHKSNSFDGTSENEGWRKCK